jgi:hypothetical protein
VLEGVLGGVLAGRAGWACWEPPHDGAADAVDLATMVTPHLPVDMSDSLASRA